MLTANDFERTREEWAERGEMWRQKADPHIDPLVLAGNGIRLRVLNRALAVTHAVTHYPQPQREDHFFPGNRARPSAIVITETHSGTITIDALKWLAEQAVPLLLLDIHGAAMAMIPAPIQPSLRGLQARQYTLSRDPQTRFTFARKLIKQKLAQSRETLLTIPKGPQLLHSRVTIEQALDINAVALAALREQTMRTPHPRSRARTPLLAPLLGIEGHAASAYFSAWQSLPLQWSGTKRKPIPNDWLRIGPRAAKSRFKAGVQLESDVNRNATHPINSMLNYGYGLLESRVRIALTAVGLDPDIGFMHTLQRFKQAPRSPLVLDIMEPLRPVVDRAVLSFVWAKKSFHPEDFMLTPDGICRLHPQMARVMIRKIDEVLGDQAVQLAKHVATWVAHHPALSDEI
jgi:CRISP-associated protein Cas1